MRTGILGKASKQLNNNTLKKKTFGAWSQWTCPKSLHYYKWSGRLDSNQRPLSPEPSAPTRLSYAPKCSNDLMYTLFPKSQTENGKNTRLFWTFNRAQQDSAYFLRETIDDSSPERRMYQSHFSGTVPRMVLGKRQIRVRRRFRLFFRFFPFRA